MPAAKWPEGSKHHEQRKGPEGPKHSEGRKRILIVSGDAGIGRFVRDSLADPRYDLRFLMEREVAAALRNERPFDLAIFFVGPIGKEGPEFLRSAAADLWARQTPVLVIPIHGDLPPSVPHTAPEGFEGLPSNLQELVRLLIGMPPLGGEGSARADNPPAPGA